MDILSYKLGKNAGGGSTGGRDWTEIGYTEEPDSIQEAFDYAKEIMQNWDATVTELTNSFYGDEKLIYFPYVDTSNATAMQAMFQLCIELQTIPKLNYEKVYNMNNFCAHCYGLKEIGNIDLKITEYNKLLENAFNSCRNLENAPKITSEAKVDMKQAFINCAKLKNVPEFELNGGISSFQNTFTNCTSLTNQSLNNIMATIKNSPSYTGTKTLKYIGLSETQATTCTTLSNWQDLVDAGWTTGY